MLVACVAAHGLHGAEHLRARGTRDEHALRMVDRSVQFGALRRGEAARTDATRVAQPQVIVLKGDGSRTALMHLQFGCICVCSFTVNNV